ncbi:MAG: nucleotide-binding protein [Trichloromonadaceae bacterium]
MKKSLLLLLTGLVAVSLASGCKDKAPETAAQTAPAASADQAAPQAAAPGMSGKVLETMNSGGYTYVQVDTGSQQVWAAAPEFQVKVGDPVIVPEGMPMANYTSPSLNRTFDVVYFVPGVMVGGAEGAVAAMGAPGGEVKMPEGHPPITGNTNGQNVDLTGINKAEGGKTVSEVFSDKSELSGKDVVIRGKVVKFSPEIMGKNWIHLQDGTGGEGTNDLTVTTSAAAKVGDTVLVTGKVTTDKDFGYGYKYDVIVEDATIAVE